MVEGEVKVVITGESNVPEMARTSGEAINDLNQKVGTLNVSQQEADKILADTAATEKATISKTELREALHGLGLEFPELHHLIRVMTSEVGISFAVVSAAIGIWHERLRAANEEAARFELPDFDIDKINQATQAWDGLAKAKQAANDAFNSPEETYKRAEEFIKSQLELKNVFGGKAENEKAARQAELGAKATEQHDLEVTARNTAANSARLPQADAAHEKAIEDAFQKSLEELTKKIVAQSDVVKAGRDKITAGQSVGPDFAAGDIKGGLGDLWGFVKGQLPEIFKGRGTDNPLERQKFNEDQLKDLQSRAATLQTELDKRKTEIDERDRLRKQAGDDAGKAQKIANELPGDQADAQQKNIIDKINERDSATGQSLLEMGTAGHLNQSQIIEIARQLLTGQLSHAQEIAGLKALADQNENRWRNIHTHFR
jgi:Sec-independent protein translocase protein TatA